MRYAVAGSLVVKARSSIHDTRTTWSKITGEVTADAANLAAAVATFQVDMTAFDAGDFLKNRTLRKDFDLDKHPQATFTLTGLRDISGEGTFRATADGILRWRGREVTLAVAGEGTLGDTRLAATGRFELDIKRLGLTAPRFLMFKVEDEVDVEVKLTGTVTP